MPNPHPKISVCIPVFNYLVEPLINALTDEIFRLPSGTIDLYLTDDASTQKEITNTNRATAQKYPFIHYQECPKNRGRSITRNQLVQRATGDYILFLDCDVIPAHPNFLSSYLQIKKTNAIICGGLQNPPFPNDDLHILRWTYGKKRESRPVTKRVKSPWKSFSTANFMAPRQYLLTHPFDETLHLYGHEDTLWGFYLQKEQMHINHIHNPVVHHGIDPTEIFLSKTRDSVKNLITIWNNTDYDPLFIKQNPLLKTGVQLKRWHLSGIIHKALGTLMPLMVKNLRSPKPSLFLYDLYKLYHLI